MLIRSQNQENSKLTGSQLVTTKRGRGRAKRNVINEEASSMQPEMPSSAQKMSSAKKRGKKDVDI